MAQEPANDAAKSPSDAPTSAPVEPVDKGDAQSNLDWNRHRWGNLNHWRGKDQYGYRWGGGHQQGNSVAADIAENWLLPYLRGRRGLKVLEIAPGGGRFTAELVRISRELHLVDMNPACIEVCKERFKYYPMVKFYVNDGRNCEVVPDRDFELVACYDSMVHMVPDIIEGYVDDASARLVSGGILWLDHSGLGEKQSGHRTAMTFQKMRAMAKKNGLEVLGQVFRNGHDCISIMRKP